MRLRMVRRHTPILCASAISLAGDRTMIIRMSRSRLSSGGMADAASARPWGVKSHRARASHFGPHVRPMSANFSSGCRRTARSTRQAATVAARSIPDGRLSVLISVVVALARRSSDEALPPALLVNGRGPRSVRIRFSKRRSSSIAVASSHHALGPVAGRQGPRDPRRGDAAGAALELDANHQPTVRAFEASRFACAPIVEPLAIIDAMGKVIAGPLTPDQRAILPDSERLADETRWNLRLTARPAHRPRSYPTGSTPMSAPSRRSAAYRNSSCRTMRRPPSSGPALRPSGQPHLRRDGRPLRDRHPAGEAEEAPRQGGWSRSS